MTNSSVQTAIPDSKQQAKELFHMTWPMVIGVLSLMSFQLADSVFISRLGIDPLAVVGFTIPIYQLVIGFQVGIGIATTALISQLLGAQKQEEAKALSGHILIFGSLVIGILCLVIWHARHPILQALGADESLTPYVDSFWKVWLFSAFYGAFLYFGYSFCRAHGNTKLPGMVMVFTSLLNIALDPLFIFVFELGLNGAAWATLCSFAAGSLLIYPKVLKKHWLSISLSVQHFLSSIRTITSIAAPAMVSQLLPAVSAMLATSIVATFGVTAVAAWGLGVRIEFFSLVLVLGLTMSLPPMIGHHYGAKRFSEIKSLTYLAFKFVLGWQLIYAFVLALGSGPLSIAMSGDARVADLLESYILLIPLSYAPLGICMIVVSASNAIGQPVRALLISMARLFIFFLPLVWLGAQMGGFYGLIIGASVGNILAGIMAFKSFEKALMNSENGELADTKTAA